MIQIQSRAERYKLSLPLSPREIPAEYYAGVVDSINLPKHYAIIAIVRQIRFMDFLMTLSNPKAKVRASDSAVLCKHACDFPEEFQIGQQVIISESDIQLGNQIVVPSALSYENIVSYFANEEQAVRKLDPKDNNTLVKKIMTGEVKDDKGTPIKEYPICFLSFKIVAGTSIKGTVDTQIRFQDPFVEMIKEPNAQKASEGAGEDKEDKAKEAKAE